jgi:two-component system, cell cycle response regulator
VSDRGDGVRADLEDRLFVKFTRAAGALNIPGLGLGLALVASLAEANGGRAYYEPNPEGGSFFCLELFAAPSPSHPAMTGAGPSGTTRLAGSGAPGGTDTQPAAAKAVVVVAGASSNQRRLLGRELRRAGYAVLEAADGIEALDLAVQADLVVLDVNLFGLSGFEVMARMNERPETEGVPVILLSEQSLPTLPARAMRLGAVDFLDLPAATGELVARVEAALRSARLAVELRRRNQELDHLSRTDALTGVWNRRHAEEALEMATATSRRLEQPLSVLMVDVDHFKAVNDQLGHRAGDRVLAHIAGVLKEHLRAGDTLGRWGGEEFLVICPDTDLPDALVLGQRLRQAVAEARLDADADPARPTVSIGVAAEVGPTPAPLVEAADRALRMAKGAGRDRVEPA